MAKALSSTAIAANNPVKSLCISAACIFLLLLPAFSSAQKEILNKKISIEIDQQRLDEALQLIGEAGDFYFSYNTNLLTGDSLVDVSVRRKTIKSVLDKLFDKKMNYRVVGDHLILQRKREKFDIPDKRADYDISGYIINGRNGERIPYASVYESTKKNSAYSNRDGFYKLTVPAGVGEVVMNISKAGFLDTVLVLRPRDDMDVTVGIMPRPTKVEPIAYQPVYGLMATRPMEDLPMVKLFVPEKQRELTRNFPFPLENIPAQISLLPSIGTNRLIGGAMTNHFSLNILAGYTNGVKGVEIGGLFNFNRGNVQGLQIAGLGNINGGQNKGVQIAGLFNHNRASVEGVQLAGLTNIARDSMNGVQIAGFNNVQMGVLRGVQISGFHNMAFENVEGLQLSGFANIARKDVKVSQISGGVNYGNNIGGVQIGGISNVARGDVNGAQLAGISNFAHKVNASQIAGIGNVCLQNVNGVQVGGIFNAADTVRAQVAGIANFANGDINGGQIAGIFNYGHTVKGVQLGFINVADTVGGASIGFLSIVKKGYRRFEVGSNQTLPMTLSFRTGVRRFYNIFAVGTDFNFNNGDWGVAYGVGTAFDFTNRIGGNVDLMSWHINENEIWSLDLNMVNSVAPSAVWKINNRLELAGGPSFNVHLSSMKDENGNFSSQQTFGQFYRRELTNVMVQMGIGYQVGFRF